MPKTQNSKLEIQGPRILNSSNPIRKTQDSKSSTRNPRLKTRIPNSRILFQNFGSQNLRISENQILIPKIQSFQVLQSPYGIIEINKSHPKIQNPQSNISSSLATQEVPVRYVVLKSNLHLHPHPQLHSS